MTSGSTDCSTQNEMVLRHLKAGKPITPQVAIDKYRIYRLAARIKDCRRMGHTINTHLVQLGRVRWASYRMP